MRARKLLLSAMHVPLDRFCLHKQLSMRVFLLRLHSAHMRCWEWRDVQLPKPVRLWHLVLRNHLFWSNITRRLVLLLRQPMRLHQSEPVRPWHLQKTCQRRVHGRWKLPLRQVVKMRLQAILRLIAFVQGHAITVNAILLPTVINTAMRTATASRVSAILLAINAESHPLGNRAPATLPAVVVSRAVIFAMP